MSCLQLDNIGDGVGKPFVTTTLEWSWTLASPMIISR